MPVRIQRRRTKGWKMPEGAVYVGRPTEWGNSFKIGADLTRDEAINEYRRMAKASDFFRAFAYRELRGKDLACWCALDQPCHADVLLEIANS